MREKKRTKRKQKVSRDWTKLKLVVCGALVLAILLTAVLAPYITPYDPYEQDLGKALLAPCREYLLGTDRYGRDMLSRVIMGARTSVFSAVFLVLIITVTGSMVGTVCGYHGGKLDTFLMRVSDVFLAFPGMVFAIAAASVLKGGLFGAVAALALISWPKYARIVRSQVDVHKKCALYRGCPAGRIRYWKNHFKTYDPQHSGAGDHHGRSGYRNDDDGDRGTFFPGAGSDAPCGGMGIYDEQRKEYAPDVALGDPGAGMRHLSYGYRL